MTCFFSHTVTVCWHVSCTSVLQIVKFQSSPAKVCLVVDSHHSTPREMTFESARVRQGEMMCFYYELESALFFPVIY